MTMRSWLGIVLLLGFVACSLSAAPSRKPVTIKGMKFTPQTLQIQVGDTVRWTNSDDRDHTVTAADKSFKSGNLRSGDTFDHTFEGAGKFTYSCSYHPRMKGTVHVSE
jgi:plastocyanin